MLDLAYKSKSHCSVCYRSNLVEVLELPDFPLTGIYVDKHPCTQFPNIDQALLRCPSCGHVQLQNVIDADYLYYDTYSHCSSKSSIATQGNDFVIQFLDCISGGKKFKRVVEIGCNDLYLLNKIEHKCHYRLGIDPIWKGKEPETTENFKIIGDFIEKVNLPEELGGKPDLILSIHTMEHIDSPRDQLRKLVDVADDDALLLIEVPSFDSLVVNCRFDQVFHQHLHYFSLASLIRMIDEIGAVYLRHAFNYRYWGGTMLVAFKKNNNLNNNPITPHRPPSMELIQKRYNIFADQLRSLMSVVENLNEIPIYGYGAAQMVPTLAYHLNSDMTFLECILDDNPDRCGLSYPNLPVWIRNRSSVNLKDGAVLVTALDSLRPILQRLITENPRYIFTPLNLL